MSTYSTPTFKKRPLGRLLVRELRCVFDVLASIFHAVYKGQPHRNVSHHCVSEAISPFSARETSMLAFLVIASCLSSALSYEFVKGKELINAAANLIHQRFEFSKPDTRQFFLEVSNLPPYSWDIQKYKIAKKIVDGNNSSYLMIFGGSSVTAGHDNYYEQSHPFVFERRVSAAFEALGVKLIVRNIAQGANNCRPFDYCYESMGGENADFILWEQSFNCGRDRAIFEYMARVAYWSKAVLYYMASGGWMPTGCPPSEENPARIDEKWTPEKSGITETIPALTEGSVQDYKNLMEAWNGDGNSCSKFSSIYGGLYKAAGPWGFNFWAHSSKLCNGGKGCDAINVVGQCAASGGPKWITAEGAYYAMDKNKKGKSWHPSAGMHLLRGETLAYNYLHFLADAVFTVEKDLKTMTAEQASKEYQAKLDALHEPMPERAMYAPADEGAGKPHCFTNYEPHFNPAQRLDSVLLGAHEGWNLVQMATWSESERLFGYKDTKPFYESTGADKELHLKVMDVRFGSIRVCGHSRKDSLAHAIFELDPNYAFPADAGASGAVAAVPYVPTSNKHAVAHADAGDDCVKLTDIPVGNHVLTVKTDPAHPGHVTTVSHLIVF